MRKALVYQHGTPAGILTEITPNAEYTFEYLPDYSGQAVSLTMPVQPEPYRFDTFPPFFEGLLPEGYQLESLLRRLKLDRDDPFSQLVTTGGDMVGSVTVKEVPA